MNRTNDTPVFSVTQSGNVASNGYYNDRLLRRAGCFELPLQPTSNHLKHAFSQPVWELLDLDQSDIVSIDDPAWKPEHSAINSRWISSRSFTWELATLIQRRKCRNSDLEDSSSLVVSESLDSNDLNPSIRRGQVSWLKSSLIEILLRFKTLILRLRLFRTIVALVDPFIQFLALAILVRLLGSHYRPLNSVSQTSKLNPFENRRLLRSNWIHISIGPTRYPSKALMSQRVRHVLIEHGTLRWSHSPGFDRWDRALRNHFRVSCANADHVWVTNLDARTLELASTFCKDKWSAFPHPYVVDSFAPYEPAIGVRDRYRDSTNADFLLFSGSSLNLRGDQNKGTQVLLDAICVVRHDLKLPIGFVFVEWGYDVTAVKSYCHENGIQDFVHFVQPMSRIRLMRTMAACDLVSDQFHLDAFGSFALRAWEQGMPVMSRPIGSYAASLIGGRPPVVSASSTAEVVEAIHMQYQLQTRLGRQKYLANHAQESRSWFTTRHHHDITQRMQTQRYSELFLNPRPAALPNLWSLTHLEEH